MAAFVRGIGIDVRAERLPAETFLPGLDIRHGVVAGGRSAVCPIRAICCTRPATSRSPTRPSAARLRSIRPPPRRLATLAWSYAALRHLDLAPEIVFHPHGYKGGAQALIDCFTKAADRGVVLGVPLLAYYGMTVEVKNAAARGVEPYPHMLRWLR